MTQQERIGIGELWLNLAAMYGKEIQRQALGFMLDSISDLDADRVAAAMREWAKSPKHRQHPLPGELRTLVQPTGDGRPGVEAAWAMLPRSEYQSIVWSDEMRQAFGIANSLIIEGDMVAARMAFKEEYERACAEARSKGKPVRWSPSFGTDKAGRAAAVVSAVEHLRITAADAQLMLPEIDELLPSHPMLSAGKSQSSLEPENL